MRVRSSAAADSVNVIAAMPPSLRPAGLDEGDDAVDETACFAGAGACYDDHVFVEAFKDRVACRLVGKCGHQLASSSAIAT